MHVPGQPLGRIRLGRRLRALREAARGPDDVITLLEAAHVIKKRNGDSIRKFESGDRLIPPLELEVLAHFYGCGADVLAELEELHEHASRPGEFASFGLPENVATYLELERAASVVRTFQDLIIPGMLQVEPYARRLLKLGKVEENAVDKWVRARLKRQERLHPSEDVSDPVQLIAVIGEEALHRFARDPDVGPAQLAQLIKFAGRDNIEIRILDLGVGMHAGMGGAFTCLAFPADVVGEFAYQETSSGGALTDLPSTVRHLGTMFSELRSQALGPNESLALIAQLAQQGGQQARLQ